MDRHLESEARALGDPTRYRIFRHLAGAETSVTVAELTALLHLTHNAIRQHLAVLQQAGLIEEERELRTRRGRPRLFYRLKPEAAGSWDTDGPYQRLAALLSEALRTQTSPYDVGVREGRRRARALPQHFDLVETLRHDMTRSGFRPTVLPAAGGCCFVIGCCPFAAVAGRDPGIVCDLHLGLAEGIAAERGKETSVLLTPCDPTVAGCELTVRQS